MTKCRKQLTFSMNFLFKATKLTTQPKFCQNDGEKSDNKRESWVTFSSQTRAPHFCCLKKKCHKVNQLFIAPISILKLQLKGSGIEGCVENWNCRMVVKQRKEGKKDFGNMGSSSSKILMILQSSASGCLCNNNFHYLYTNHFALLKISSFSNQKSSSILVRNDLTNTLLAAMRRQIKIMRSWKWMGP